MVILTTFCWANQGGNTIRGRLLDDYSPFQISGFSLYSWADLGTYASGHPIFQGVSTLHAFMRDDVSLSTGAMLLATWDDGHLLVAEKGNVIAINTALHVPFPLHSGGWTGDGWTLLHNTIVYSYLVGTSWLTYSPQSGTILSGDSVDIEVTFDATEILVGDYYAELIITSNDPDEGQVTLPAHMRAVDRGDVNADFNIDLLDILYLINYLLKSASAPDLIQAGDVNCDGVVDIADVVYLINYLYSGGPSPCD